MSSADTLILSDFTVGTIPELQEELIRHLMGAGAVAVDRSGVHRPNSAMLQLLAAFSRDLLAQSRSIQWCGESPAFDRAAKTLGLTASLGLPADG